MNSALLALGAVLTIGGAAGLVLALRHGQTGHRDAERLTFRLATVGLAVGSLAFLAAVMLADRG